MPKLTIDGKEVIVEDGTNLIQACEQAGIEIPRFCYHSRLAIAGNCRMCLVEVEKSPKPVASCAQPAIDNMVVHTNSPMVKKAREGVMEFLLINHPLDCPICDQAGECDLQDQAMTYGRDHGRYKEEKRAVEEKDFGPLVQTHMTRCIHCTRCVRFTTEVAGISNMGAAYRGENTEILTFLEKVVSSELSGNIIDLCPVGALTSKPYQFKARSWELEKTESIDVLDAVGSNIRIDSRGMEVMRILPRLNEAVNEEWISDKTRFACDGLTRQRLDQPYLKKNGKLQPCSWQEAFNKINKKLKNLKAKEIAAIAGDMVDVEAMYALRDLWKKIGSKNLDCRQYGENLPFYSRTDYLFNTGIEGIELSDFCLIIGSNPRKEAAILNSRIRKSFLKGMKTALIGSQVDLNYKYDYLGNELTILTDILLGKHKICENIKAAKNPMLIIGSQVASLEDGRAIINLIKKIAEKYNFIRNDWNGYNYLNVAAARAGGLDIGFVPVDSGFGTKEILEKAKEGEIKFLYLLGADEFEATDLSNSFVVYQGHHGDKGAHLADVILPGCAYTEKDATYVNLEGRVQRTKKAVSAPKMAEEDFMIIVKIAEMLELGLGYKNLTEIRAKIAKEFAHFIFIGKVIKSQYMPAIDETDCKTKVISYTDSSYFLTDPISRASLTMAKSVRAFEKGACS